MKRWIAALMILILAASLVACGGSDQKEESATAAPAETSAQAVSNPKGSVTIEDFLNSSSGIVAVKSFKDNAEASGNCVASCYADGSTLVFEGKFTQEISGEQLDAVNEAIEEYLASEDIAAGMGVVVDTLKDYGVADPTVRIVFRSVDDAILGQRTYE